MSTTALYFVWVWTSNNIGNANLLGVLGNTLSVPIQTELI
jgi:hypothetical protein